MRDQKSVRDGVSKDGYGEKNVLTSIIVSGVGILSVLVLVFPSILPDVIPLIGTLDEVAATTLLISCLAYFGVDLGNIFRPKSKKDDGVIDVEVEDR